MITEIVINHHHLIFLKKGANNKPMPILIINNKNNNNDNNYAEINDRLENLSLDELYALRRRVSELIVAAKIIEDEKMDSLNAYISTNFI